MSSRGKYFLVALLAILVIGSGLYVHGRSMDAPGSAEKSIENDNSFHTLLPMAQSAPAIALRTMDGQPVRLADMRGKVVVITFWASWCPSCRHELGLMQQLHERWKNDGVTVLAVNWRESAAEVKEFLADARITIPAVLDESGAAFDQFNAAFLPTSYVISRTGQVVAKAVGVPEWHSERTTDLLRRLLAERT